MLIVIDKWGEYYERYMAAKMALSEKYGIGGQDPPIIKQLEDAYQETDLSVSVILLLKNVTMYTYIYV